MNARPARNFSSGQPGRALRPAGEDAVWVEPALLLALAVAVVALFSLMVTAVVDAAQQGPVARVVQSTFAARTDGAAPYAPQAEMRVKPQRPAGSGASPAASD